MGGTNPSEGKMERLDIAFEAFKRLKLQLPPDDHRVITESDTRLKLIDPMLTEVLGWPKLEILTEDHVGPGRLDYLLADHEGKPCAIVEAKARDIQLIRDGKRGERLKLGGPAFSGCLSIITTQVVPYCAAKRVAIGFLTNGLQWVGFYGNRTDGIQLDDDFGVAFSSLDEIENAFETFYELFSYDGYRREMIHGYLAGARLRGEVVVHDARRVADLVATARVKRSGNQDYYSGFAALLDEVFRPIHQDPDKLLECFVDTRESHDADQRLTRFTEDLVRDVVVVSDAGDYVEHVQKRVETLRKPGLAKPVEASTPPAESVPRSHGVIVQLLGERSTGTTTFLRRFYTRTLDRKVRDHVLYLHLHFDKVLDADKDRVGLELVHGLENELFGKDGPTPALLLEVYKTEWSREQRSHVPTDAEPTASLSDFTKDLKRRIASKPFDHAIRLAAFAVSNRRILPCVVFDDFDHYPAEQIRSLVQMATAISNSVASVVTLAMDDTTAWRVRDLDLVAKQSPITFWLPRPMVRKVLENRFEYIRKQLQPDPAGGTQSTRQLEGRVGRAGMRWKLSEADTVIKGIQSVLLWEQEDIVNWVGALANYDIRDVLEFGKALLCSPIVGIENHLVAAFGGQAPERDTVLRALLSPEHIWYRPDKSRTVINVFNFMDRDRFALLLPFRLLSILDAAMARDTAASLDVRGFVPIRRLQECMAALGVSHATTLNCLEMMRERGLVQPYDPSKACRDDADGTVKINPRGALHLEWATEEPIYVSMMAETDLLIDPAAHAKLRRARFYNEAPQAGDYLRKAVPKICEAYVRYLEDHVQPVAGSGFESNAMRAAETKVVAFKTFRPALREVKLSS